MKHRITRWTTPTSRLVLPGASCCRLGLIFVSLGLVLAVASPATAGGWHEFSLHAKQMARQAAPPRQMPAGGKAAALEVADAGAGGVILATALAEADDASTCAATAEDCREELGKLRADTLDSINLDIHVTGVAGNDYPCECRLEGEVFQPRRFASTTMTWKAAGYCHKPLYFEQWNLERYGHSFHPVADPFISAAHFFASVPALPYKMGVELPWECIYPLGYYRPGDCAPWTIPAPPISARGAAVEAAAATGIIFILP